MVRKNMKNSEIYGIAAQLVEYVTNLNLALPVKVNFYLQKNINAIITIAQELETERGKILDTYGTINGETGNYDFEEDNLQKANQELIDLFNLEQEVPIYEIALSAFDDVVLDTNQFKAISFMIKDEEE